MPQEAQARIKINKLLEASDWRLLDEGNTQANVILEPNIKIDDLGTDFEGVKKGFIDFLLLDDKGFPLAVLEAKKAEKNPLDGKEQARKYVKSQNVRFVLLSNGDSHYFWDLERGNPEVITEFPTQLSLQQRLSFNPDYKLLSAEVVGEDYIALCQNPHFREEPLFQDEHTRANYLQQQGLRFLRPYQLAAIYALQKAAQQGRERFLFEMATGTGKTLISAAIIRLFLTTGNATRVLFLVDRLELEEQARKNFSSYLANDFISRVYKENKDNWYKAEIVISTVQSLSVQDKYKKIFLPTDFDLIIADESHRSIGSNFRAVFEYFIGYKLGLTATPKGYLKNIGDELATNDPRAWEKRQLLDTYQTFGCKSGYPTFVYSLQNGVKDGYLISPVVIDARTDITTDLLSKKGYAVMLTDEEGEQKQQDFFINDFERKFISEKTNRVFCQAFLENALLDPISGEIGKSIIFCVSQKHASKINQILNEYASELWGNKYKADFAMQVSSNISDAQSFSIRFANNNLNGSTNFLENYKSSKTRVCVTVGMMTTGYDCQDILNIVLMRPIFSPIDFVQIKGRGTRKFSFEYTNEDREKRVIAKDKFRLFDFFAVYEYFEKEFNYDEVLKLPVQTGMGEGGDSEGVSPLEIFTRDKIKTLSKQDVGTEGMKVDRKLFARACETLQKDDELKTAVANKQWDRAVKITRDKYENKPDLFLTLDKIRRLENLDYRLTWQEFLARVFGLINRFKTKDEKLEQECDKFIAIYKPDKNVLLIKNFIKAYVGDENFRNIINDPQGDIRHQSIYPFENYKKLGKWGRIIAEYAKDYVPFNIYMD